MSMKLHQKTTTGSSYTTSRTVPEGSKPACYRDTCTCMLLQHYPQKPRISRGVLSKRTGKDVCDREQGLGRQRSRSLPCKASPRVSGRLRSPPGMPGPGATATAAAHAACHTEGSRAQECTLRLRTGWLCAGYYQGS